jgi:hypothetical protein
MFWSGTYVVAHAYSASGLNYITLEDTLAAAMVNGLRWCGKENDTDGYDFVSCPNNCKDNKWADVAFWGLASKTVIYNKDYLIQFCLFVLFEVRSVSIR